MAPAANPTTIKRIHREVADVKKEDLGGMTLAPYNDNLFLWRGSIPGPEGSPYEGGVYHIEVQLMSDYPFSAPRAKFLTKIYHMNINEQGGICIDILKYNWSPALSLFKVLLSLSSLLTDPNPKDPLVPGIATQYIRDRKLHDDTAREWTRRFATPAKPMLPAAPAVAQPATVPGSSTSSSSRNEVLSIPETIVLSDSDGDGAEVPTTTTTNGRRKRKRGGEEDSVQAPPPRRSRRQNAVVGGGANGAEASAFRAASGSGSGDGEVIVIEDSSPIAPSRARGSRSGTARRGGAAATSRTAPTAGDEVILIED